MKKIKIMLTAVTVLAIVGGALAFKAKSFSGGDVYKEGQNGCTILSTQEKYDPNSPQDQVRGTITSPTCVNDLPIDYVQ